MSDRTAGSTIQGFLYQFNLSLHTLLCESHSEVHIEGLIEDIDVYDETYTKAIQCKYHEAVDKFYWSSVYEPILRIMEGWNKNNKVEFLLYAYYPEFEANSEKKISEEILSEVLQTKNEKLRKLANKIPSNFDKQGFLENFKFICGEQLSVLEKNVKAALQEIFKDEETVENLIYPNAIHYIANISIEKDSSKRFITKDSLITLLKDKKEVIVSRWVKELNSYSKLLNLKRKSLKANLKRNVRRRCFYISHDSIPTFYDGIVLFISKYLGIYHYKAVHTQTPIFCLDCDQTLFNNVLVRLRKINILCQTGFIGNIFHKDDFFKEPMVTNKGKGVIQREFSIRLLHSEHKNILCTGKIDDLFVISKYKIDFEEVQDVVCEHLDVTSFDDLEYLIGID